MTSPHITRQAQPMSRMIDEVGSCTDLAKLLAPLDKKPDACTPQDQVARYMAGIARSKEGREMFEWMMDISKRRPFRVVGQTIEETALLAANRQGIEGFADAILAAIAHGQTILKREEEADQ